jgi:hypothetical protein
MFHLAAYKTSSGAAVAIGTSMSMVADGYTAQGTTGYRLTDPHRLAAAYSRGASNTQAEFRSPTLNGLGLWNVWPLNLSANVPANPQVDDYRAFAPFIPTYEDFEGHTANSNGAGEQFDLFAWLATPNHRFDLSLIPAMVSSGDPYIGRRLTLNSTTTLNKALQGWGADVALTFEQLPRGGVYAVLGGECVAAACEAWRINFPRSPLYAGRKPFPGSICQQAVGDVPNKLGRNWLGIWGVFHTWELPFASLYGIAAGTVAVNLNLDVVYLGPGDPSGSVFQNALTVLGNAA